MWWTLSQIFKEVHRNSLRDYDRNMSLASDVTDWHNSFFFLTSLFSICLLTLHMFDLYLSPREESLPHLHQGQKLRRRGMEKEK